MLIIYNIIISILACLSPVISLFLPKLKERQKLINKNKKMVMQNNQQTIWFHSASMGEFEQAKPIIEKLKQIFNYNKKNIKIVCTFFSPSGYNTQKNYPFADIITYLPLDTYWNVNNFINKIKPDIAIFIRYELWLNYIYILNKKNIPIFLLNATVPQNSTFIMRQFYKYIFNLISEIYTVSEKDTQQIQAICNKKGIFVPNIHTATDTRLDRIIEKVVATKINPLLNKKNLYGDNLVLVCGSIWNEDVDIIHSAITKLNKTKNNISLILVPHEPTEQHINYIKNLFPVYILLSELEKSGANVLLEQSCVIIVDSIGKLLRLYVMADFAYIGGAFGVGVHSLTEPAGYGIPLVCGKKCFNSPDAANLIACNALTSVKNSAELYYWFKQMLDKTERKKIGKAAIKYIEQNSGSTEKIVDKILEKLSLLNKDN